MIVEDTFGENKRKNRKSNYESLRITICPLTSHERISSWLEQMQLWPKSRRGMDQSGEVAATAVRGASNSFS